MFPGRRIYATCLLLCVSLALPAHACPDKPASVYTGTLGKQSIVMELDPATPYQVNGRYFYTRHHRDIQLIGKQLAAGHLQLFEGAEEMPGRPMLDLRKQSHGRWVGSWQGSAGRALKLTLQPATLPAAAELPGALKRMAHEDPYQYLRLRGLSLQKGDQQVFVGYQLQWWIEPNSKVTLFQILDGYPTVQRARINAVLMDRLWLEVGSFYECMTGMGARDGDYEQTITPRLLSSNVVGISVFTNYNCGGAHPDFGDAPMNLDARTARTLSLEDILWVGKGKPFQYTYGINADDRFSAGDFDTYSRYRSTDFAP